MGFKVAGVELVNNGGVADEVPVDLSEVKAEALLAEARLDTIA
jgi:hypothetical protein